MIFIFGCDSIGLKKFLKDLVQEIRDRKEEIKYKLIIDDKEYKNKECSTDLSGKRFGTFERRSGLLRMERVKFAIEDLKINHETGMCHLKVKVY